MRLLVDAQEPVAELDPDARVEGAEELVEQDDLRLEGEGPREGHALPLTAGELVGVAVAEVGELHEREELVDARRGGGRRGAAHVEAEGDVLARRHVAEEAEEIHEGAREVEVVVTGGVGVDDGDGRRSSHPWMPRGLPWRAAMTTTERVTIPPPGPAFQSWVMSPACAILSTSASSESAATSASKPPPMARDWAPLPWYDSRKVTVSPVRSRQWRWKAGSTARP